MLQRFGVGGHAPRLVTGFEQIFLRLLPVFSACVVIGQQAREFVQMIGKKRFNRLRHATMNGAPLLDKNAAVCGLLHKCVFEDVLEFRHLLSLANEFSMLKFNQAALKVALRCADGRQHTNEKAAANDRGQLERLFEVFVQAIDARQNQALNGVGQAHLVDLFDHLPRLVSRVARQHAVGHQ